MKEDCKALCIGGAIGSVLSLPMLLALGETFWNWLIITGIMWLCFLAILYFMGAWGDDDD